MRLYLISNTKKFKGAVSLVYDKDSILAKVDFTNTDLNSKQIGQMLKLISSSEGSIGEGFKDADTIIVEGEFEVSFEDFMRNYPYKRNTHLALAYWNKMKKVDQVQAFVAAADYRKHCERERAWYKPKIAVAWLKNEEYLNDWKAL